VEAIMSSRERERRTGELFTTILRGWARQAREHPHSLAHLLADYPTAVLCARLQCDEQTVYWLQLYGPPCRRRWDLEIAAMAKDLGLDAARLAALLREVLTFPQMNEGEQP
jgi:hypothetical protein